MWFQVVREGMKVTKTTGKTTQNSPSLFRSDGEIMKKSCVFKWVLLAVFFAYSPSQADPVADELALHISEKFVVGSPFTPSTEEDSKNIVEASTNENGETSEFPLPRPPAWFLTHPPRSTPQPAPEIAPNTTGHPCAHGCQEPKRAQTAVFSKDPCKNKCYIEMNTCQLDSNNQFRQQCNDRFMTCLRGCFKTK
jgi:hypothetical protein